jgi:hypothetical protein
VPKYEYRYFIEDGPFKDKEARAKLQKEQTERYKQLMKLMRATRKDKRRKQAKLTRGLKENAFHCCLDCKKDFEAFDNERLCYLDCMKRKSHLRGPRLQCFLDHYEPGHNDEYGLKICMLPYLKCKNFVDYKSDRIACGPLTKDGEYNQNCGKETAKSYLAD